ncbi:hypothetical protein K501DRAFT_312275 [Backusella circina FSU 941]|nr:hypothetical protein K501DRAFT_312275 [Backusella circina FSU 941]
MEIDGQSFPFEDAVVMNISILKLLRDQKTNERKQVIVKNDNFSENDASILRTHHRDTSVRSTVKHLEIPSSTAFNWQKEKKSAEASGGFVELRNYESGRPAVRSPKLTDIH